MTDSAACWYHWIPSFSPSLDYDIINIGLIIQTVETMDTAMTHRDITSRECRESKFPVAFSHSWHGPWRPPAGILSDVLSWHWATQVSEWDPLEQRTSFQAHGPVERSSVCKLRRRSIRVHHNWLQVATWPGSGRVLWTLCHQSPPWTFPSNSSPKFYSFVH